MADWNLYQPPNIIGNMAAGYQAGQALGKQKRLDAALSQIDLTKPETLVPVLQADPATGASLLTASTEMAKAQHETAGRVAAGNYLMALYGGNRGGAALGGGSAGSSNAALGSSATAPASPAPASPAASATSLTGSAPDTGDASAATTPPAGGEIVVNAPAQPSPLEQARADFIRNDPENYLKFETAIAGMTKAQRDNYDGTLSTFDGVLQGVKSIPEADQAGRMAYIQARRSQLVQAGVPAEMIDNFVPTDANITSQDNQVLGAKGVLERQDKDRSFALDQDKFSETQRHDRADESTAAANAATSRGQLGVAQGNLSMRQKEFAQKQGGAGGGSIATPTSAAEYNALPPGTRYYKNGQVRIKQ